ncbi:carbohydrate ABC transporter permease [Candidatus Villigracilis saccharophilus]|uniref:carbohydrate ABC transporter permease n=1 Tax=Candidatus Villigracilis saccharophilus TaxID=3140684 RepID=UPI003134E239|nr:carbohydrate ABC transporter permease [Anaerolineales bacterium]
MATSSVSHGSSTTPIYRRFLPILREGLSMIGVTGLGLLALLIFLLPLGYVLATAFKLDSQMTTVGAPLWPAAPSTYNYEGEDYPLYNVPTEDGSTRRLALVRPFRENSDMVDPAHPEEGVFNVKGRWRTWDAIYKFSPNWKNFTDAWDQVNFPRLFRNSLVLAGVGTIGTLISCILVAYGFTRFQLPGKNILFVILVSTIVLPPQATIIPLYILFNKLGWTGTWLPLLVPAFFANAYDVFLLRQYFMSIPKELDEAAMLDGANPLRILVSIIIPQSVPAITAVTIFHFFFVWNQYFEPLVYLLGNEKLYPVSVGIGQFVTTFSTYPGRSAATAVLAMLLPAVMFFLAQRQFMQGIVVTGVEK